MRRLISSFNGGELSPLMLMRVDSDRNNNGCRTFKNFLPMVQGGAFQRPPSQFIAASQRTTSYKSRLIPFRYSVTTNYVIELSHQKIAFFSNGSKLTSDYGQAVTLDSPYLESQLFDIQYYQINDVVYLMHPSHAPRKLTRTSVNSWTIEEVIPKYPPMLDEDIKTTVDWGNAIATLAEDVVFTTTPSPTYSTIGPTAFNLFVVNTSSSTNLVINLQKLVAGTWTTFKSFTILPNSSPHQGNMGHGEIFNSTTSVRLTRSGSASYSASYTITRYEWPLQRAEDTTLTPSGTTGSITVTANAQVFAEGHVGGYFELAHVRPALDSATNKTGVNLSLNGTTTVNSTSIKVLGKCDIHTFGTWFGYLGLQKLAKDGVTWVNYRNWRSSGTRNVQDTVEFLEQETVRLTFDGTSAGTSAFAVLEAVDPKIYGIIKVTGFTSPTEVTADVVKTLAETTATRFWREGAWSTYRGFPRTATLYEQRLWFASTTSYPQMIISSVTNDFENFQRNTLDDSAMLFNIADRESNPIVWLASKPEGLAVGTTSAEWLMTGAGSNEPITPTSVTLKEQSRYGSAPLQPETWNEVSLFAQRGAQKIREFVYAFERNGYVAPELTLFAEHLLRPTIAQMAYSANPHALLWCVMKDGTLAVMSYERAQGVIAWSRIEFDGATVESVATVYGQGTNTDEVWLVIKRPASREVIRLDPTWWQQLNAGTPLAYLDSVVTITNASPTTSLTRPSHIAAGTTTAIIADGVRLADTTWPTSTITLSVAATVVKIGIPMAAEIQPARTEVQMPDGTAQSRRFRCNKVTVSVYKSGSFQYRHDAAKPWDTYTQSLTTGDIDLLLDNSHEGSVDVTLKNTSEKPLNLLAMVAHLQPYG